MADETEHTFHSLVLNQLPVDPPNEWKSLQEVQSFFGKKCFSHQQQYLKHRGKNGEMAADEHRILKTNIPFNTLKIPDMLRVALPQGFSSHTRAVAVRELMEDGIHVFAPAVSGAGKTKLTFDVAQEAFSLYFDFNGGHGKVPQRDVKEFWRRCSKLANNAR